MALAIDRRTLKKYIKNLILIIVGSIILAFGTAVFLVPCNLIAGGTSGLAIIIEAILKLIFGQDFKSVDITIFVVTWLLFVLGFFFLGKKFSMNTLVATIVEPLIVALIYRTGIFDFISNEFICDPSCQDYLIKLLLAGVLGGVCVGLGVAITFHGEGSTGGFDILQFIFKKYFNINQALSSFVLDGIIVVGGMIVMSTILPGLIGILSAFITALVIEFVYVRGGGYYKAEIISDKPEDILKFVHEKMERGSTIVEVKGGFTSSDRKLLIVAFDKTQLMQFKHRLAEVDPNAFVIITEVTSAYGEGFDIPYVKRRKNRLNGKK